EQDLLAIVAERRRMPEGHVGVGGRIDANRVGRLTDVEQQTVPGAGAAGEADVRVDGDVVTLRRPGRRTTTPTTAATTGSRRVRRRTGGRRSCRCTGGRRCGGTSRRRCCGGARGASRRSTGAT